MDVQRHPISVCTAILGSTCTWFKKHSADFHGRAADLVHGLRGTAMPMRQALKEEQCREEKGISTVPKHKYASKACSPKGSKGAPT
ncbi:2-oxoglutarate dehydrogenase E1 component [Zea mays]|uniref:2-oxoglutarate dehydrogenase E1 component n=1 Tax=Zea mays TaxID=4577 RepID=A0A1D6IA41_MAIZE|nr:2-oxoglutarate dehydrogenase E1 component [Zea mays]